jgi:hypothetical protein
MAYKVVDWRGRMPGSPVSNIGPPQKKTKGVVAHYSGPDGEMYRLFRAGRISLFDLIAWEARYQMTPGLYDPGFAVNGMMYHEVVWGDTVYLVRNPDARLWHCKDGTDPTSWNYAAVATHVPIVEGEQASARTIQTLRERADDHLRTMGHGRDRLRGHMEISSTSCPGTLMRAFVYPYRAGRMGRVTAPAPIPTSQKIPAPKKAYFLGGTPSDRAIAAAAASACQASGVPAKALVDPVDIDWAANASLEEPLGTYPLTVVGHQLPSASLSAALTRVGSSCSPKRPTTVSG